VQCSFLFPQNGVERLAALSDDLVVTEPEGSLALERMLNAKAFCAAKLVVFEIGIMNYLRDLLYGLVVDAKVLHERFEGAVLAMMCELHLEHVEGKRVGVSAPVRRKYESRLGIEEFADQPGGADAINLRLGSREPRSACELFGASLGRVDVSSRSAAVPERASGAASETDVTRGTLDISVACVTQIT